LAQLAQEIGAKLAPIFKLNVDLGPLRQFLSSLVSQTNVQIIQILLRPKKKTKIENLSARRAKLFCGGISY
jgi:hypothetical protein